MKRAARVDDPWCLNDFANFRRHSLLWNLSRDPPFVVFVMIPKITKQRRIKSELKVMVSLSPDNISRPSDVLDCPHFRRSNLWNSLRNFLMVRQSCFRSCVWTKEWVLPLIRMGYEDPPLPDSRLNPNCLVQPASVYRVAMRAPDP